MGQSRVYKMHSSLKRNILVIIYLISFLLTSIIAGTSQFYYKNISEFKELDISKSCVVHVLVEELSSRTNYRINCTIYQPRSVSITTECVALNVVRIIGEYDTVRILCSAKRLLDFKYDGMQVRN